MVYGAATRNAAAAPPRTASEATSREGLVPSVIQTAMSGTTSDEAARVLRGRGESRGGAGPGKAGGALAFVRGQRQQERQRDEERDRHVGQHVVRLADVERHDRHQAGGERRVPRAPAHADAVDEQDRERAKGGRDGASPEVEVRVSDLIERAPLAERRAGQEAQDGDAELHVEVEARVVEEMRVEVAGPHHLDDAGHDLGLVDADVERDARAERRRTGGGRRPPG